MKQILLHIIVIFFVISPFSAQSQKLALAKADDYFENLNYAKALPIYIKLYKRDSTNIYLTRKIADSYFLMSDYDLSLPFYKKIVQENKYQPEDIFRYAQLLKMEGHDDQAKDYYMLFASLKPEDKRGQMELSNIDLTKNADKIVVKYQIKNLQLNTRFIDMSPTLLNDKLVFASSGNILKKKKQVSGYNNQPFLELYIARPDGSSDRISTFSKKINSKYHEGPVCFSKDGKTMYFTRNNFPDVTFKQQEAKLNNLKIFIAKWNGTEWTDISEFPYNSDKYSVGHAALSPDNDIIYFSSNMPGGYGATDIYYCRLVDGMWDKPVNLGPSVNTEGKEMFPYVDENGVLYFSSNGIPGFGGLDIFSAYRNEDGTYRVINLGKPLNSSYDDFGYIKNNFDCSSGFFTSNRPGGKGYDDIYSFSIETAELTVKCYDTKTKDILPYTTIILKSEDGELISSTLSDENGFASFMVQPCNNYSITAQKENYTGDSKLISFNLGSIELAQDLELNLQQEFFDLNIAIVDKSTCKNISGAHIEYSAGNNKKEIICKNGDLTLKLTPSTKFSFFANATGYYGNTKAFESDSIINDSEILVIELEKIERGKTIVLRDIYYDVNKWDIRPDAARELDKVAKILDNNPDIKVELSSHTDCRASSAYNEKLSQRRAESAVDYLVKQGINRNRLVPKGYGESKLLNRCADGVNCTEEDHQVNRRTELKILN